MYFGCQGLETNQIRARAKRNDSLQNCRDFSAINYVLFHKIGKGEEKEAFQKVELLLLVSRQIDDLSSPLQIDNLSPPLPCQIASNPRLIFYREFYSAANKVRLIGQAQRTVC